MTPDPTQRFTTRVEDYVRYRPGYPPAVLDVLRRDCALTPASVIADIGCGPGNLSVLFLQNGNQVFGVEPNPAMRAAAGQALAAYPNFRAIDARAETTLLPSASVDFVTAAQSFHWFDQVAARAEFLRVLKPAGWVVLVWNERGSAPSEFHDDYEAMLRRHGVNYRAIRAARGDEKSVSAFFQGSESMWDGLQPVQRPIHRRSFTHEQLFDYEGLKGRLLSSSYAPLPGDPGHNEMLTELRAIFDRHQRSNRIRFQYETTMWYGQLAP